MRTQENSGAVERVSILHLEDDPADAELLAMTLAGDGLACDVTVASSSSAFEAALAGPAFDIIIADYALPAFDGIRAQELAAVRAPGVPFIFLSGTLGEETAVDRLKAGAVDYVVKQRMDRMPRAVRRALAEAGERRQRQHAEQALRELNADLEKRIDERTAALAISEARLHAVLDNSPAGIYVRDLEGRYVLVNRELERIIGKPRDQILGRTPAEILPPRLAARLAEHDKVVFTTRSRVVFEETVPGEDGARVFQSAQIPLFGPDGGLVGLCGLSADVTERKNAEEIVKLAQLEADRANRAKSDFLSRMSHDLRTPLNAVIGFAQLLELEGVAPGQEEPVRQILSGARHLLDLINEVLEITRIEAGHLPLSTESVDVAEIIESTVALLQTLAGRRGVRIETHTDPGAPEFVCADRSRVGQVLLNFLSNAIKYNREEGAVTVTLTHGTSGHCRVSVSDQGQGIPSSKLHLLFMPFERLGAEATSVEGTGLGLSVCKGLIEAMHGTLGADSVPGKGSTFWMELPADPDGTRRTADLRQAVAPENKRPAVSGHIIYIEDNPSNVKLLERLLRQRPNVRLSSFPTGRAGLDAVRSVQPDLLLLDRHLPDMTGDEILIELRRNASTAAIPVVMLTADAKPAAVPEPGASGLRAYLTKPLNVAEVLRVIDEILDEAHPGEPPSGRMRG